MRGMSFFTVLVRPCNGCGEDALVIEPTMCVTNPSGDAGTCRSAERMGIDKEMTVQPITPDPRGAAAIDRGLDAREWREWWKKYDRAPEPGPSEIM